MLYKKLSPELAGITHLKKMKIELSYLRLILFIFLCSFQNPVKAQDLEWFNQIKDVYDDVDINEVITDSLGNVYIGGSYDDQKSLGVDNSASAEVNFMGTIPAGNSHEQMGFLAKLNSGGVIQWIKKFGSPSSTTGYSPLAMVEKKGYLYVVGSFQYSAAPGLDFDPDAGTRQIQSTTATDFFVSKYNSSTGAMVWAYAGFGAGGSDLPQGIVIDHSENIYIMGQVSNGATPVDFNIKAPTANINQVGIASTNQLYLVKYDKDCNFSWRKNITNSLNCTTSGALAIDLANSYVYMAGGVFQNGGLNPNFVGASLTVDASTYDAYLAKYNYSGTLQWVKNIAAGTSNNYVTSMDIDNSGNVYAGGVFNGTADFDPSAGTSNLVSAGGGDGFVAKYDASGTRLWSYKIGSAATSEGVYSIQVTSGGRILAGGEINGLTQTNFNPEGTGGAQNKGGAGYEIWFGEYDAGFLYQWAYAIAPTAGTNTFESTANSIAIDKNNSPYPVYVYGYMSHTNTQNFNPGGAGVFGPGLGPQTSTGFASTNCINGFLAKYSTQITLPVELISFVAACDKGTININWQTASQTNNNYFTIERSSDASHFDTIGTVQGAGSISQAMEYSFIDPNPITGISYYRLRQTDYDGKTEAFNLVAVSCQDEDPVSMNLKPNPATNELCISMNGKDELITILITDVIGQPVMRVKASENGETKINLGQLTKGIYFVSSPSLKLKPIKLMMQ